MSYDSAMEFSIIKQHFTGLGAPSPSEVHLGIGDDAACWSAPSGCLHVMSVDTAVADVHFPKAGNWYDIAYRSVGCAASDLAAMAAQPAFATLAVSLPDHQSEQLSALSQGLEQALSDAGLALIGGDTTSASELILTLTVHGWAQRPITRAGAKAGDLIFVSGATGLAGAALQAGLQNELPSAWWQAYWRPQGRFDLIQVVSEQATAAIDISDGLLADMTHICQRSGIHAHIDSASLDLSWRETLNEENALQLALTAGDDYQLLCTAPPSARAEMAAAGFTVIGKCLPGTPSVSVSRDGQPLTFSTLGYQHQS